ncbi:DegV family protein [Streptococcus hongkongensis]|nr:DegV domain-containing protein [Streptococcus uberis]
MTWKIVADSGCDLTALTNENDQIVYERVPLTIRIGQENFNDDFNLDVDQMMSTMYASSEAATSSCPSPDAFMQAFKGADNVIAITITGSLSGSNNSARLGKEMLLEENPNLNIHIIDSLSAGGEMDLIVLELERLISKGLTFDQVVKEITDYQKKTGLLFALAKVDNLVKNGRVSKLLGTVIGLMNIRMVGCASEEGRLELLQKARGQKKAVLSIVDEMKKAGYNGGKVFVCHRNNEKICHQILEKLKESFPTATMAIANSSGLCSFYAEEEGILLGYEKA